MPVPDWRAVDSLTYFGKVWKEHAVADLGQDVFLVHIDRHLLHEMSGAVSFVGLERSGYAVRNPGMTLATVDHVVETLPGRGDATRIPRGSEFIAGLRAGCRKSGIRLFDLGDAEQGVVHVIAPELGIALPGATLACGDSHTCTVGGVGTLGFGVGSSDGEAILATQCLLLVRPRTMRVRIDGVLAAGVTAKDAVLLLIRRMSAEGATGHAVELCGSAVAAMTVEERLTLCNMAAEFGARTAFVAPDDVTYEYLADRPFSPQGRLWDQAVDHWTSLRTDADARFDREVQIDCLGMAPQVTWGTSPEHVVGVCEPLPDPADADTAHRRDAMARALDYADLRPGMTLCGLKIDGAFIGSCTNSRLSDLRAAAMVLRGARVAPGVRAICTPGSMAVKRAAEAEGLDRIFTNAGFEWREPGCSLCMSGGAGGESFRPGSRVIASTNRNFEHRMGRDVRAHLASPATVAWSAVHGAIADVRQRCG